MSAAKRLHTSEVLECPVCGVWTTHLALEVGRRLEDIPISGHMVGFNDFQGHTLFRQCEGSDKTLADFDLSTTIARRPLLMAERQARTEHDAYAGKVAALQKALDSANRGVARVDAAHAKAKAALAAFDAERPKATVTR